MEKTNPLYQKNYPEWKKNVIRAIRVFSASFIPAFIVVLKGANITGIENYSELKELLIKILISAIFAGGVAGISSVFNMLRDMYPDSVFFAKIVL